MRKLLITLCSIMVFGIASHAQNDLNAYSDSILGEYEVKHQGENTIVKVSKDQDGTYNAQVIWVDHRLDKNGNVRLDEKNSDKRLRNVECDKIVLMTGLRYDPSRKKWGDTKVYDPTRGIRANVVCEFQSDGTLRVKGSLLGFSQSMYWTKIK